MSEYSPAVQSAIQELVIANRILANEKVLDAFGHVSVRHPERTDRYFMSCSRSPEHVTEQDIMEFDLDSNAIDARGRHPYTERPIHGCIYQARSDVNSVCHNHAQALLPFGVTNRPLRPVFHVAAAIGAQVPVWEIREEFGDSTNMLVVDNARGHSLARKLGAGRVCLMRGHGSVVAARDLRATVFVAITLMENAAVQTQAMLLCGGEINYLSVGEVNEVTDKVVLGPVSQNRTWDYWCERAGYKRR